MSYSTPWDSINSMIPLLILKYVGFSFVSFSRTEWRKMYVHLLEFIWVIVILWHFENYNFMSSWLLNILHSHYFALANLEKEWVPCLILNPYLFLFKCNILLLMFQCLGIWRLDIGWHTYIMCKKFFLFSNLLKLPLFL